MPHHHRVGRNEAVPNPAPIALGRSGGRRARGRGGLPRGRISLLAVGSRLAQFHHAVRRALHPPGARDRTDRHREPRHRPLALRGAGHPADAGEARQAPAGRAFGRRARAGRTRAAWRAGSRRAPGPASGSSGRARPSSTPSSLKTQRVYAELRRVLPPETIVALDAGAAPAYGYDRLQFRRPKTFFTPLDLGGLGFAFLWRWAPNLPAALRRRWWPCHGDGGFR